MAIRAHVRKITLITADRGDDYGKNNRLDETVGDVFYIHVGLNAIKISAGIRTQEKYSGDIAADNADKVKQRREQGKADDGSRNSWDDEVPERINAHDANLRGDDWPALAVIMIAVRTGPNSLTRDRPTRAPRASCAPNLTRA